MAERNQNNPLSDGIENADGNDPMAQFRQGLMYGLGVGAPRDYARAMACYRRAAYAGEVRAQSNLGWMYGTGRGVPQDYVQSWAWYSISAAGGQETARRNRDIVESRLPPSQLEQAQTLARELFEEISPVEKGRY